MATNFSQTAAYIWSLADLLRGDFKQSQYGRVILPFTILRRTRMRAGVVEAGGAEAVRESLSRWASWRAMPAKSFCCGPPSSRSTTRPNGPVQAGQQRDIKSNLLSYVESFSKDAREIFEHFQIRRVHRSTPGREPAVQGRAKGRQHGPQPRSDQHHDMGLVFEELIRRFAESSNETAGEHFTHATSCG